MKKNRKSKIKKKNIMSKMKKIESKIKKRTLKIKRYSNNNWKLCIDFVFLINTNWKYGIVQINHFVVSGWHYTWRDQLRLLWVSPCESHSVTHFFFYKETIKWIQPILLRNVFESWKRNFHGLTKSQLTLWEMFPDNQVCGTHRVFATHRY